MIYLRPMDENIYVKSNQLVFAKGIAQLARHLDLRIFLLLCLHA